MKKAFHFDLKAVDDAGKFSGYGSVFGNVDSGRDIVAKGAFKDSLAEMAGRGAHPKMLWNHDPSQPIGVWTKVVEDDHGLAVEGKLTLGVTRASEIHYLMKDGAIDGLSIGYQTVQSEMDRNKKVRMITRAKLWEVSVVTFPMNEAARVSDVKEWGELNPRELERTLRSELRLSSDDAVRAVAIMKKHLSRDVADDEALDIGREDHGAARELLEAIRASRSILNSK